MDVGGSPREYRRDTPIEVLADGDRRVRNAVLRGEGGSTPSLVEVAGFDYADLGGRLMATILPETATGEADSVALCLSYYDSNPAQTESFGRIQQRGFDSIGADSSSTRCDVIEPELRRSLEYDDRGFVSRLTDARGHTTDFVRDDLGRITEITNARNEVTKLTYSGPNAGIADSSLWPAGRLLAEIEREALADGVPQRIRFVYDERENMVATQLNAGDPDMSGGYELITVESRVHDSDGNTIQSTDAGRAAASIGDTGSTVIEWDYDVVGRLVSERDNASAVHETVFEYDPFGNRTLVRRKLGPSILKDITFVYDNADRLIQISEPGPSGSLITNFRYNAVGDVVSVEEPGSQTPRTTRYRYDGLTRLKEVQQPDYDDVTNNRHVLYQYDGRSRLEQVENARGNIDRYVYESWGGLSRLAIYASETVFDQPGPEDRDVRYSYDKEGNLLSVSDSSVSLGSLPAAATNADGDTLLADRLYTYEYDELNRVTKTIAHYISGPEAGTALGSVFDAHGNRKTLALNSSDLVDEFCFDRQDRLIRAQTLDVSASATCAALPNAISMAYLENSQLASRTYTASGILESFGYHAEGILQEIELTDSAPGDVLSLTYAFDGLRNVDTITETDSGSTDDFDYGYDVAERLTAATFPSHTSLAAEGYVYDDRGNRDDSTTSVYAYDAGNRMTTSPQGTHCYDDDGNPTEIWTGATCATGDLVRRFTWDATNRLLAVEVGTGGSSSTTVGTYQYDPFGRRIAKTSSGTTTLYLWDGDRLFAEYGTGSTLERRYQYGDGFAPLRFVAGGTGQCNDGVDNDGDGQTDAGSDSDCSSAQDQTEGTEYDVHADHLDTPRVVTDGSGAVAWKAAYSSYGVATVTANPGLEFNVRFPGQYFDAETGLHYNWHRYYDPSIGRYISADPIGQGGGVNVYQYSLDRPTSLVDPYGLLVGTVIARGAGLVTGQTAAEVAAGGKIVDSAVGLIAAGAEAAGVSPDFGSAQEYADAASAGAAAVGAVSSKTLAQALAAQGSPVGALALAGVAGFEGGTALNYLLGKAGLDAHLSFYGDLAYELFGSGDQDCEDAKEASSSGVSATAP